MKIALLGCTGQIGRGLIRVLSGAHELALYARRTDVMRDWLELQGIATDVHELEAFSSGSFDLIINAIGDGVPGKIRAAGQSIVATTERFDRLCLDHLHRGSAGAYIFLSTGRVYGPDYEGARMPRAQPLPVEAFGPHDSYPRAKREAEQRHREQVSGAIADIRIFGYVSEEIGLDDDFLVSQILRALLDGKVFATAPHDVVRDYVGLEDLVELIERMIAIGVSNGAYDIVSAQPTTKFAMLEALAEGFGLRYAVEGEQVRIPSDGVPETISRDASARAIGHVPRRTSLENVLATAAALASAHGHDKRRYAQ